MILTFSISEINNVRSSEKGIASQSPFIPQNEGRVNKKSTKKKKDLKNVIIVESSYLEYIKNEYFALPNATYWILEEEGEYKSALRITETESGLFYLEALETPPKEREKGYGTELLMKVIKTMKEDGPFRLCDSVGKHNTPSLKVHEKCGFSVVSEDAYDYLNKEVDDRCYGLEYVYKG